MSSLYLTPADHGRREHPRVRVEQGPGAGERREIGRALTVASHPDRVCDAAEDERADQHRDECAGDERQGLAVLPMSDDPCHAGQPVPEGVPALRRVCTGSEQAL